MHWETLWVKNKRKRKRKKEEEKKKERGREKERKEEERENSFLVVTEEGIVNQTFLFVP